MKQMSLSSRLKDASVGEDGTASGKLFQSLGPLFAKDRSK